MTTRKYLGMLVPLLTTGCGDGPSGPGGPRESGPNLRIEAAYFVQATQNRLGTVPLVAGRNAYLRVFVTADAPNTAAPDVRVTLYHGETVKETLTIPAGRPGVPTAVAQADLAGSWNARIPASLVQPGLRLLAEVDPGSGIAEANEADNRFPASGAPLGMRVESMPPFRIRFVPIHQRSNGLVGRVNEGNTHEFMSLARKLLPIPGYDADVRAPYTVDGLSLDPQGNSWQGLVSALDAVRVAEGSDRYYYGVVQTEYPGGGVVGIANGIPSRTSLGWDRPGDAAETVAHELGHNLGRYHAPCGGAGGADPGFPYQQGLIGVYGLDVESGELKVPVEHSDIMGYCDAKFWISDYNYTGMFNHLASAPQVSAARQPSLLVWGRISDGELVLEPAFQLVTRPSLPTRPGRYRIQGLASSGSAVFSLSFAGEKLPDVRGDKRHFAFAVPLSPEQMSRVVELQLTDTRGSARVRRASATLRAGRASLPGSAHGPAVEAAGRVVRWDATTYPMAMVRDGRTGVVLSLPRGGTAAIPAGVAEVELILSDGVRSTSRRAGEIAPNVDIPLAPSPY